MMDLASVENLLYLASWLLRACMRGVGGQPNYLLYSETLTSGNVTNLRLCITEVNTRQPC